VIPRSFASGYDAKDRELLQAMYRVSGKPVELNILTPTPQSPMGWQNALEFCRESFRRACACTRSSRPTSSSCT
jgi:hypothetical protein